MLDNSYFRVYNVIRVYNQKQKLFEIITWVEKKEHQGFADYIRLNEILVFEEQL